MSALRRGCCAVLVASAVGCGGSGFESGFSVDTSAFSFTATRHAGLPAPQTLAIAVTARDAARISVGPAPGAPDPTPWLELLLGGTTDRPQLEARILRTDLDYGVRATTLRLVLERADGSVIGSRDIPVTFTLVPGVLQVDYTSVSIEQIAGGAPPPEHGIWVSAGTDSYSWTATVEYVDGSGWLQVDPGGDTLGATLRIRTVDTASLTPGTYEARIHVAGIGGAADVGVELLVRPPHLTLSSPGTGFRAIVGQDATSVGTTIEVNSEAGVLSYDTTVAYGVGASGWLDVTAPGTAPGTVALAPNTTALPPGTYLATITLTPSNGSPPVEIEVVYWLFTPQLVVTHVQAGFAAIVDQPTPPAAILVNVGAEAGTIPYATSISYAGASSGWLDVVGTGTAPETLQIAPNTTLLPSGTNVAKVKLTPANGAAPVEIGVRYDLTLPEFGVSTNALAFAVDSTTPVSALSRTIATTDTGARFAWTASSPQPWVKVSPSRGISGGTVTIAVDPAALDALDGAGYPALVAFEATAPGVPPATRSVAVSLTLDLPFVRTVAPHVAYAGETKEVVVRGRGFAAVADPVIQFGGSAGSAVAVLSDTALRVTPPAGLAPGRHSVTIAATNQLGLARSRAALTVVPVRVHTPALISAPGTRRRLVYDAERGCLYAASPSAGAVQRWCDSGAAWTQTELPLPDVRDVALAPDGAELLAISGASLHRIDAASFTVVETVPASQLGIWLSAEEALVSVVFENDGAAEILGGSGWLRLYRWDPRAGWIARWGGTTPAWGALPTILATSLDGDRLVTGDSGSGVSNPVLWYLDCAEGIGRMVEAANVSSVTLDRSGLRTGAGGAIYDRDLAWMGSTATESMTVSPGGTRAWAYQPGTPARILTYDVSGIAVVPVGSGVDLTADPGAAAGTANLLVASPDGGTLFVDGPNGIAVLPAPP